MFRISNFLCLQISRFLTIGLAFFLASSLEAEQWAIKARRLTGESDKVREEAIEALHEIPHLETLLRAELKGDRKYLALDVIAALSLRGMLSDLFLLSERDENGAVYLAINALLSPSNASDISSLYRQRVANRRRAEVSYPSLVVMIDTLARMGALLPKWELAALMCHDSYEVRIAALYHTRSALLKIGDATYLSLLEEALEKNPFQLRLQALHIVEDLPPQMKPLAVPLLKHCIHDPNPEVQANCERLQRSR